MMLLHRAVPLTIGRIRAGNRSGSDRDRRSGQGHRADAIERAAQRLIDAAATGVPCEPIIDLLPDGTVDDAYAVQQRVIELTRHGARRVGRKIGLTSPVVQQMFGVDRPDFGVLFADMAIGDSEPVPSTG